MRKIKAKTEINQDELNLLEGCLVTLDYFTELSLVLLESDFLTETIYTKIKTEYLEYAYKAEILKKEISEKYRKYLQLEPNVFYTIDFANSEIIFYE